MGTTGKNIIYSQTCSGSPRAITEGIPFQRLVAVSLLFARLPAVFQGIKQKPDKHQITEEERKRNKMRRKNEQAKSVITILLGYLIAYAMRGLKESPHFSTVAKVGATSRALFVDFSTNSECLMTNPINTSMV